MVLCVQSVCNKKYFLGCFRPEKDHQCYPWLQGGGSWLADGFLLMTMDVFMQMVVGLLISRSRPPFKKELTGFTGLHKDFLGAAGIGSCALIAV